MNRATPRTLFPRLSPPLEDFMLTRIARVFPALSGSLLVCALALSTLPASAAPVNPQIRPYRTIEAQQIRPNMQLVVDRSGSMSLDMNGMCRDGLAPPSCGGDYSCGAGQPDPRCCQTTFEDNCYGLGGPGPEFKDGRWVCQPGCNPDPSIESGRWVWTGPSRMAILKNVLGASVTITDYLGTPPDPGCQDGKNDDTVIPPTCGGIDQPDQNGSYPARPVTTLPARLVDRNSVRVNIGLENFSSLGNSYGANERVIMNTAQLQTQCGTIPREAAWVDTYLLSAYVGGATTRAAGYTIATVCAQSIQSLTPYRGTSTVAGLNLAGMVHTSVEFATAPSATTSICPTSPFYASYTTPTTADPQRSCNRPLFNLLLTDGVSNNCNTSASGNDNSISYPACSGNNDVALVGSPAAVIDRLYNNGNNSNNSNVSMRTIVVGISTDLTNANAQQELRLNAYFGKSDQADPYGLAGLKLAQAYNASGDALCQDANGVPGTCSLTLTTPYTYPADPYLRDDTQYVIADAANSSAAVRADGVTCVTPSGKPTVCVGTGYVCGHEYNFTATSSTGLSQALQAAFASVASGDYTTETPSIAQGVRSSGGLNMDLIYTASSEYPSYNGHLRAQDINQCVDALGQSVLCSDNTALGFKVLWDAGAQINDTATNPIGTTQSAGSYYASRQLFTYDINGTALGTSSTTDYQFLPLVPFTPGNEATIGNIYATVTGQSSGNITAAMIDFVRGNDGTGSPRPWQLGDVINSPPVVLAPPINFRQGATINHDIFTAKFNGRRPLILMGASDGMVHAFDAGFGFEVWAFIPPDALPNLLQLYRNFSTPGSILFMGQTSDTASHVFGVASPINLGDVDLNAPDTTTGCTAASPTSCVSNWRTLAVTGMGKGGTAVFALDVTSSFVGRTYNGVTLLSDVDAAAYQTDNGNSAPFKLLWYKNAQSAGFTGLGETWSSPAISLDNEASSSSPPVVGRWIVTFGSGPAPDTISCPAPGPCPPQPTLATPVGNVGYTRGVHFNAVKARDGAPILAATPLGTSDASALIAASMKASNATYSTQTINFVDQLVDKSYQADLAGRMWEIDISSPTPAAATWTKRTIWPCANGTAACTASNGTSQPIYNSPAIGFYQDKHTLLTGNNPYRRISFHAWASGEFTETRLAVNNPNCGPAPGDGTTCFVQNLYVSKFDFQPLAPYNSPGITLLGRNTTVIPLLNMTYRLSADPLNTSTHAYSKHARIMGSPMIFIPVLLAEDNKTVKVWPKARDITVLYTAYDPNQSGQGGCTGESSFILVKPCGDNDSCVGSTGYNAGTAPYAQLASYGVASSPIVYKGQIIMNVSSKYSFAAARIAGVNRFGPSGSTDPLLGAWREVF